MSVHFVPRRLVSLLLVLGIFLSGTAPTLAMPSMLPSKDAARVSMSMTMPGMNMQADCMSMMHSAKSTNHAPGKCSGDGCSGDCLSCALPVVLLGDAVVMPVVHRGSEPPTAIDVNRNGIGTPPALPPPILRA